MRRAYSRSAGVVSTRRRKSPNRGSAWTRRDHHGTVLAEFTPAPDDSAAPEIDRGRLRRLLLESLRPGTVRWGRRLVRTAPLGGGAHRLEFADGTFAEADLVIGADGAWSKVRPAVSDAEPQHLGVCYLDARFDEVDSRHPELARLVGAGHLFANDNDGRGVILQRNSDGVVRGYLAFRAAPDWHRTAAVDLTDRDGLRAHLASEFAHWAAPLREAIMRGDGDYLPRSFQALPAPLSWEHAPGVTLLGDAAHLMAPFGGHGANLAMLDGAELAHAVATAPAAALDRAVAGYESAMFARSGELAMRSNEALVRFFTPTDTPHLPPDHAQEHRDYLARESAYRRERSNPGR
ncbi:FAD-dependent monooxygenase [Kitasatospora sp. NPDC002227]|uniref:FAD-dependent oxidoreductase n=1 Tax=Kitasatospora sp. NPDC002227 TaxID=3154773 RepID=UPI00332DF867